MRSNRVREVWSTDSDSSLQSVVERPETPSLLRQMLTSTLSWQARNETSVRKALASPRVAPQWVAALLALGATVSIETDGDTAETPLMEARGADIRALHIRAEGLRWGEAHVARTPADDPIVAAVAALKLGGGMVEEARVALTGVWPEAVRLAQAPAKLVGGSLGRERIEAVAEAVEQEVQPKGDFLGSEAYRRAMAAVMTRRALEACMGWGVGGEADER